MGIWTHPSAHLTEAAVPEEPQGGVRDAPEGKLAVLPGFDQNSVIEGHLIDQSENVHQTGGQIPVVIIGIPV